MCIGATRRSQAFRIWQFRYPAQDRATRTQSQDWIGNADQRAFCRNFQGEQQAPQTCELIQSGLKLIVDNDLGRGS